MCIKYDNYKLEHPAFLIGNGINFSSKKSLSWQKLLFNLSPEELKESLNIQSDIDIDEVSKGLSYPEIADLIYQFKRKKDDKLSFYKYKLQICKEIENCQALEVNEKHNAVISFAINNDIPILTTNFDTTFLKTEKLKDIENKKLRWSKINKNSSKPFYDRINLLNMYISNQKNVTDIRNSFALWFIHGINKTKTNQKNIRITNKDYAESINNLSNHLKSLKKIQDNQNQDETWLNIFLNNDLLILGLGLEQSEIDLRWLLLERFLYLNKLEELNKLNNNDFQRPETIFVYSDKSKMHKAKKEYLETLKIKLVQRDYGNVFDFTKT